MRDWTVAITMKCPGRTRFTSPLQGVYYVAVHQNRYGSNEPDLADRKFPDSLPYFMGLALFMNEKVALP